MCSQQYHETRKDPTVCLVTLLSMNASDVCKAVETGVGTLLATVKLSVESAVSAQRAAAKTVTAHTDLLKKAMDVS